SGQELTHKDFSWQNIWFESKAVSRGNQLIKISSLEQLESEYDGELVVHVLEKMSVAYNGLTLNKLIIDTSKLFDTLEEKDLFLTKVALQGYEYSDYYEEYVYELSNCTRYLVSKDFPKLTRKALPMAIRKASYELALIDIRDFEIKD
ncbi:MAG: PD-(D/E)XK motif protein, partial [Bacilli bacterium]